MKTLRDGVREYLEMRRALGFKLRLAGAALYDFVSFLEQEGTSYITTELALRWATGPQGVQPAQWANRLSFVRTFTRYWNATDPRTEIPPLSLLPYRYQRCIPYIYNSEEIRRLLEAAKNLQPETGLKRWTYYTLFGLLAVTGLRISEAISLNCEEVDLERGILTIHDAKFRKSRFVPVHISTRNRLKQYAHHRGHYLPNRISSNFFVSEKGKPLKDFTVRWTFVKLSRQIGLRGPSDSSGPRLHDFRHRFAASTLMYWYRSGLDVEQRLPTLSTYLGHAHVADTYWYLSAVPELLALAGSRVEKRWEVLP